MFVITKCLPDLVNIFFQSSPFHKAVDLASVPMYMDYVFNPMDFTTLEKVCQNNLEIKSKVTTHKISN